MATWYDRRAMNKIEETFVDEAINFPLHMHIKDSRVEVAGPRANHNRILKAAAFCLR